MKINNIHQDLKELYKAKASVKSIFGAVFEHEDEIKRCMNIFRSGFWSVAPFAFETYETYGIQLQPNKSLKESNVVLGDENGFMTTSNNLSGFIPFRQLKMLRNPKFIKYILDDWELLDELSLAFREYTDNLDPLNFLKEYLHNPEKIALLENPSEQYSKVYLDFWNHYNNTPEQHAFSALMQKMEADQSYFPEFEAKNYGTWNTRAYNAMAQRAYSKIDVDKVVQFENYNFESIIQPHGFDSVAYSFDILPSAIMATNALSGIIALFDSNPDLNFNYSPQIAKHPLFSATEHLRINKKTYDGTEHIKAAKIIDEELNNPVMAWNALVTAGYWSGVNHNEPNMEAWQSAIDLAKKHNWTEIHEVLTNQLAFYNFYKDKM